MAGPVLSATLHVPNHYLSIQEAIEAAEPGDTVTVASGVYPLHRGNITINKNNLTIKSAYGPGKTVIQGKGGVPVIRIEEKIRCVVEGFTITLMENQEGTSVQGGGVYCGPSSSPTLIHNVIKDNQAVLGGGVYCDLYCSATISNSIISGNVATRHGGGIFSYDAPINVLNNDLVGNSAKGSGGAVFCRKATPRLVNNLIWKNRADMGGGIACDRSSTVIINNTIVANSGAYGGGVFFESGSVRIANTILWDNGDDLYAPRFSASSRPDHSNIGEGDFRGINGNISADPAFVAPDLGDFRLSEGSPCINAGNDDQIYNDVDGSRNDMGAFGGPQGVLRPWFQADKMSNRQ